MIECNKVTEIFKKGDLKVKKKDKEILEIENKEAPVEEAVEQAAEVTEEAAVEVEAVAEEAVEVAEELPEIAEEAEETEVAEEAAEVEVDSATEAMADGAAEVAVPAAVAGKSLVKKIFCARNIIIAVAVLLVAVAVFATFYILNHGDSSPEKAAERYIQAMIDRDGKKANKVMAQCAKNKIFGYSDGEKQATDAKTEKGIVQFFKGYANYTGESAFATATKWKIQSTKVVSLAKSGKSVEDFQKLHDEGFGNGTNDKISQVAVVQVKAKDTATGENVTAQVYCVKLGLRWYVYDPAISLVK